MDFVHPKDPTLKFPFVKDELRDPEQMMQDLFDEFITGKQEWDESKWTLKRIYDDHWEVDQISCHYTEEIRVKCQFLNYPTIVQIWRSLDPEEIRSYTRVDDIRHSLLYKYKAKECNNFNPALCLRLYLGFNDSREPVKIIDPSAGWGDRMITAIAAGDFVAQYDGYDPNKALQEPYRRIMETLDHKHKCRFFCEPFQTAEVPKEYYDLGVTSPPYFDAEVYSSDKTQSLNEDTRDYKSWLSNFYEPYLKNLVYSIRRGGKIILYVSNYTSNGRPIDLEEQTVKILNRDCKLLKRGGLITTKDARRSRPFFVFRKF